MASTQSIDGVQQIIAVSSGKGGVGKSTVSANLACALARQGKRVGLMDADIYGPNMPTMMGIVDAPQIKKDPKRGEVFLPPSGHGVKVMSMGFLAPPDQPMIWRGPMLHNILSQFCHQVDWGELDILVIDMPPGTGDVQLSLGQLLPLTGAILVTTPQEIALQDVRKAVQMWKKVKVPIIGIIENMSYFEDPSGMRHEIFGAGGGEVLAKKYETELLAQFPLQPQIREGGDDGIPVASEASKRSESETFLRLAEVVAVRLDQMKAEGVNPADIVQIGRFE